MLTKRTIWVKVHAVGSSPWQITVFQMLPVQFDLLVVSYGKGSNKIILVMGIDFVFPCPACCMQSLINTLILKS